MQSIPRDEIVVIGTDFNGHVGEGNRGDKEVWYSGKECRRTDGGRLCNKDGNGCSEYFLPEEAGTQRDLSEWR